MGTEQLVQQFSVEEILKTLLGSINSYLVSRNLIRVTSRSVKCLIKSSRVDLTLVGKCLRERHLLKEMQFVICL